MFPLVSSLILYTYIAAGPYLRKKTFFHYFQADKKVSLWHELKVLSFSRALSHVYGSLFLSLFLKVILNILGGLMYLETTRKDRNQNSSSSIFPATSPASTATAVGLSAKVQEKYLALCELFIAQGVPEICRHFKRSVSQRVKNLDLKEKLSIIDIEVLINDIIKIAENEEPPQSESNPLRNPCKILLQVNHLQMSDLDQSESDSLKQLIANAMDIFETPDFKSVIHDAASVGLSTVLDQLTESLNNSRAAKTEDDSFVNLSELQLPVAKFIPLLNNLVRDHPRSKSGPPDPVLSWLSKLELTHRFSVNVYEAFCQPQTC